MKMMKNWLCFIVSALTALLLCSGCGPHRHAPGEGAEQTGTGSLELQAVADGLNREAFLCRYNDPARSIGFSRQALEYINGEIPAYESGRLRSWNNMAFGYYMLSRHEEAWRYVDSVKVRCEGRRNRDCDMEYTIARLLEARLLQRACMIADSYQVLAELEQGRSLRRMKNHDLYPYAQLEYFITSLTLNYNYRHGMEANVAEQLEMIETYQGKLPCDYAEDMAMNYALAYGYSQLCGEEDTAGENLRKSLYYCMENLRILGSGSHECRYQLANTIQMLAFLSEDEKIPAESWERNDSVCGELAAWMSENLGLELPEGADVSMELFEWSRARFCKLDDPYQRLGSYMAAGRHCMITGDTLGAQQYYLGALEDEKIPRDFAPKFESMLYDGLLRSGAEGSEAERLEWYEREKEISSRIARNEKTDFQLMTQLSRSEHTSRIYLALALALAFALALASALAIALRGKQLALKKETRNLQEAKQKDVERIANVETCLSVLRHDVTPFVNYLQNKNLPPELRNEVLEQLLRTFENIKNWTNLSIPTGLQFKGEVFVLDEVFKAVEQELPGADYEPCDCKVWGDRLLLQILLRNLVQNALRFKKERVTVSAQAEGDFVHIKVEDDGCGMDEEMIENLFRADRLNENGESHSGFGLILCRYIIKKHDDNTRRGCRIWAENRTEGGSSMHLLIARQYE